MKNTFFIFILFLLLPTVCVAADVMPYQNFKDHIILEHPRLFFNANTLDLVKDRALNEESALLNTMKNRIDNEISKGIQFVNLLAPDGATNNNYQYGFRASESALLYKVYGEVKYLNFTRAVLDSLANYYKLRNDASLNIAWDAFSQISALCAYDWIYNDLSKAERIDIGARLLVEISRMPYDKSREEYFRENTGDYTTGFYGPPVLPWYAGLVFYKAGINDNLALQLLNKGYQDHMNLFQYRKSIVGDRGGASTACMQYAFADYPWAEFNFLHTFNSSTGLDMAAQWPYMMGYVKYMDWNWLPKNREYGYGDTHHKTNALPLKDMNCNLAQYIHFYGEDNPEFLSTANRLLSRTSRKSTDTMPFARFFLQTYDTGGSSSSTIVNGADAIFFEYMGQVFMRSGVGENDTYATFTTDGILTKHKHYDNNNFVIYKHGYRTMDTGTRPQPGLHLSHYYARTVAHNCVTIRMPGETLPKYWGQASLLEGEQPVPNDGGQNKILGSKLIAFEKHQHYIYLASDASEAYSNKKANLVLRQFVYIQPDVFVVFDKIKATQASYKKTWLMHFASEPELLANQTFRETSDGGRLYCRTLYPKNAELSKIGGPGKQFWSDGKNWPMPVLIPEDWRYENASSIPSDDLPMLGQWRVELSPSAASKKDYFLNIIQVGNDGLSALPQSELIERNGMLGVSFNYKDKYYEIMFQTDDKNHGKEIIVSSTTVPTVYIDETFNYSQGALKAVGAHDSWQHDGDINNWTSDFMVESPALTYSNAGGSYCLSGRGKSLGVNYLMSANTQATDYRIYKSFVDNPIEEGTVYLSFLYTPNGNKVSKTSRLLMLTNDEAPKKAFHIYVGTDDKDTSFKLGTTHGSNNFGEIGWGENIPNARLSETFLVVMKLELNGSENFKNNKSYLYLNPEVGSAEEPEPYATSLPIASNGNHTLFIKNLQFATSGNAYVAFKASGIRISNTWQDAVASFTTEVNADKSAIDNNSISLKVMGNMISASEEGLFEVYNMQGAKVYQMDKVSSTVLTLEPGIYVLHFTAASGQKSIRKLVLK